MSRLINVSLNVCLTKWGMITRSNFRRSKQEVESFQFHKIKSFNNICQILSEDRIFYQEIKSSNNGFKNFRSCVRICNLFFGTRLKVANNAFKSLLETFDLVSKIWSCAKTHFWSPEIWSNDPQPTKCCLTNCVLIQLELTKG